MAAEGAPVVVNPGGTLPPLVFVRTWPSEPAGLRRLGERLGPEQPLIGLPEPGGAGDVYPRTVEAWVDHHLAGLRGIDIAPPYYIAGFSFGGVVALEMARRLIAAGTPVAYVALIDTVRPKRNPVRLRPYVEYHLHEFLELAPEARRPYVRHLVGVGLHRRRLQLRRWAMRTANRLGIRRRRPTRGPRDFKFAAPLVRAIRVSYLKYIPEPFDQPVALFYTAASVDMCAGDPSLRWSRFLRGGFESFAIEGQHMEILDEPHVESIARQLAHSLAAARGRIDLDTKPA